MQTLRSYIKENYESKAEFARKMQVHAPQVSLWLSLNYYVHDGFIFKPLREIPKK